MTREEEALDLGSNDKIQFARLLDEVRAVGLEPEAQERICASMGVAPEDLEALFRRATAYWEYIKANRPRRRPMSAEETQHAADADGRVRGVVAVTCDALLSTPPHLFPAVLADRLSVRGHRLLEPAHKLVGQAGDVLLFEVAGRLERHDATIADQADFMRIVHGCDVAGWTQEKVQRVASRSTYKDTCCGAWCALHPEQVRLGSIVEGIDGDGVIADPLVYPFTLVDYRRTIEWIEEQVEELCNQT